MHAAVVLPAYRSAIAVFEAAFEAMNHDTDAVYTLHSLPMGTKLDEFQHAYGTPMLLSTEAEKLDEGEAEIL